jgi:DNA-binding MarR family transcriptional regulator
MGLSSRDWRVIVLVADSSYRLTPSDVARKLSITKQTAHRMAARLIRAGLINLQPNWRDKRLLLIDLTPRASSLIQQVRARFQEEAINFAAMLDERHVKTAAAVMLEIRNALGELNRHGRPQARRRRAPISVPPPAPPTRESVAASNPNPATADSPAG